MIGRALIASKQGIKQANKALYRNSLTKSVLARDLNFSRSTVSKFFNHKPVDRLYFEEICFQLGLEWQKIVDIPASESEIDNLQNNLADIDSLVEQVQTLYQGDSRILSLSHLTFQDYLNAREIINTSYSKSLESIVQHITKPNWHKAFLLAVGLMQPADQLLLSMKREIDSFVALDKTLQDFLRWSNRKSLSSEAPYKYKPAFIRFFLLNNIFHASEKPELESAHIVILTLAVALVDFDNVITAAFARTKKLIIGIYSIDDPDLLHTLQCTCTYAKVINIEDGVYLHSLNAFAVTLALDRNFNQVLQKLKRQRPKIDENEEKFNAWWQANSQAWTEKLRVIMMKYYEIFHNCQLSPEQIKLLKQYRDGNRLLVDCLNNATSNVSPEVRSHIEDTLLLPIAEIEKRPFKN